MVHILIWVLNALFTVSALAGYFAFLASNRLMFALGLFNNAYWLIIGLYYGWYANITITAYFVIVNIVGWQAWHKPNKWLKRIWLILALMLVVTLYINIQVGFNGIAAMINFANVTLYAVTYTLRMYTKHKKLCIVLHLVNQVAYLPNVLLANPILWGCVTRQCFMVYANILTLARPTNWLTKLVNSQKVKQVLATKAGKLFNK